MRGYNGDRVHLNASWGFYLGQQSRLPISVEPEIDAYIRQRAHRMFSSLEHTMPDSDFLVGTAPTIADLCNYGEVPYARLCDYDLSQWPKVNAWCGRIERLPDYRDPFDLLPMQDAEIKSAS